MQCNALLYDLIHRFADSIREKPFLLVNYLAHTSPSITSINHIVSTTTFFDNPPLRSPFISLAADPHLIIMSDETAPVATAADQSIAATQETVEAPSTHTPAVGGVNDVQEKDETTGRKVSRLVRHL